MPDYSGNVIRVTNSEYEELCKHAKSVGWNLLVVEVTSSGYRVLVKKPEPKIESNQRELL
jgi:hypothetical protein